VNTTDRRIVYGVPPWQYERAIFLPVTIAQQLAHVGRVLHSSSWGEVRRKAAPDLFVQLLALAGFGDFAAAAPHDDDDLSQAAFLESLRAVVDTQGGYLPEDDWPFDPTAIRAFVDGDWPPATARLMVEFLPQEVVALGELDGAASSEPTVHFAVQRVDLVLARLGELGYECLQDQGLINWIDG
jgi:hypothetical protein